MKSAIIHRNAMDKPKVDFLREKYQLDASPRKPILFFGRLLALLLATGSVALAALSFNVDWSGEGAGSFPSFNLFSTIRHLVSAQDRELRGQKDDRVNFLLLGVGGAGHEGPQLSDTILFASLKPTTKQVGLLSIPRDMTVPIPGYGWRKVNNANAFGESAEPGSGPALAAEVIGGVLKQPVHYYLRVDFDGFAQAVDELGGVDVFVERAFTDEQYPILGQEEANCDGQADKASGVRPQDSSDEIETAPASSLPPPAPIDYSCRFERLSFKQGWTHMDGATALAFVRSRHGNNGEASDFARSRRQQKLLLAVREKLVSAETLLNPGRITKLLDAVRENVATNMQLWEIISVAGLIKDLDPSKVASRVLDASPESPLYATSLNGAYVLLPKNDDWRPIEAMAANAFDAASAALASAPPKPKMVNIEVQNGTTVNGLGFRTSQLLEKQGFTVSKVGNAKDRAYEHTVVYDLTDGKAPDDLKALRAFLEAEVTRTSGGWVNPGDVLPREMTVAPEDPSALATDSTVDFLVILGQNSANLARN